ncbi:MAG: SdrD B-like domain-containing protein [Chloroflexota bacterium]
MNSTKKFIKQLGLQSARWLAIIALILTTILPPPLVTHLVTETAEQITPAQWTSLHEPLLDTVTDLSTTLLPKPATATAAPNLLIDKTVSNANPSAGEVFVYTIRYRCASLTEHCFNAQIVDDVSDDLTIVSHSQAGGNVVAVDENNNTITWDLASGNVPNRLDAGSAGLLRIRVRFPQCGTQSPGAGSTLSNVATFSEDSAGSVSSAANGADITVPTINSCPGSAPPNPTDFEKRANGNWVSPGDIEIAYTIDIPTNPVTSTGTYTVTDIFPDGYTLHTMDISDETNIATEVQCDGVWYDNPITDDELGASVDLQGPAATNCTTEPTPYDANDQIMYTNMDAIRYIVSPSGGDTRIKMSFALSTTYPVGGIVRNTATLDEPPGTDIDGNGTPGEVLSASDDRTVLDAMIVTQLDKDTSIKPGYVDNNSSSILDGNGDLPTSFNPPNSSGHANLDLTSVYLAENDAVWLFEIGLNNSSSYGFDFSDPIIIDELPSEFDFVQDAQTGNFVQAAMLDSPFDNAYDPLYNPACVNPIVTVEEDFNGTQDKVTLSFPGCTLYGGGTDNVIFFYISARLKPGTPAGESVRNDVFVTGSNGEMLRCSNSQPAVDTICSRSTSFTIQTLASVESSKYVQGALDAQFHRFPDSGFTNLDGDAVYELTIDNISNVEYTSIDIVDILPHIGDTSLLSTDARGSAWSAELASELVIERYYPITNTWVAVSASDLPSGTLYSTSTNPCRLDALGLELSVDEGTATTPAGCDANPWSGANATTATGARSFGFRYAPADPLGPGEQLRVRATTQQLTGEADADSGDIAWNSFAYGVTYSDPDNGGAATTLLATEPLKVGIEMIDTETTAALGDYVWFDSNNNGTQEVGEPPIEGVRVNLYAADGTTPVLDNEGNQRTTTTNEDGLYMFWGLTPSTTYVIRLDDANDHELTGALSGLTVTSADSSGDDATDSDATLDITDGYPEITAMTGAAGTETRTYDFGFIQPASVGNFVWDDLNEDGVQDAGEPGFAGITVNLLDDTGATVDTLVTDSTGNYFFSNIVPGLYSIEFDPASLPITRTFTAQGASGNTATDSDANAAGVTTQFVLAAGETDIIWDAGLVPPPTDPAAITGRAWEDINDDGLDNNSEPGVPGIEVLLVDTSGLPLATATTDDNGEYRFDNLTPGVTYQVVFNPDETQTVTSKQDVGAGANETIDSDASPTTGETPSVTPIANEAIMHIDVGIISKLSLGNLVWLDVNDNGLVDSDEAGIAGVTVWLLNSGSTRIFTTTTDSTGYYVFTALNPGTYSVEVAVPNGLRSSTDIGTTATPNPTDSDDNGQGIADSGTVQSATLTLASTGGPTGEAGHGVPINGALDTTPDNKAYYTVDFGFVQEVMIGNRVWLESDGDGFASTGEIVPATGITVTAIDAASNVYTATTDANGYYTMTVLGYAAYTLTVPTPAGYTPSTIVKADADSSPDANDNANHNASGAVVIVTTADNLTIDFAFYAEPQVAVEKLLITSDPVLPGTTISFTIRITNTGIVTITTLPLTDTYDSTYLTWLGGTPQSETTGDTGQILWSDLTQTGSNGFGIDLGPGDVFEVVASFVAALDTTSLADTATINTAQVFTQTAADDVRIYNATNVVLTNRSVAVEDNRVLLQWSTIDETDIIGFHVLRQEVASDGTMGEAVRLTNDAEMILADGTSIGADYRYEDVTANTEGDYHYSLALVKADGTQVMMDMGQLGQSSSEQIWRVYLPVLMN